MSDCQKTQECLAAFLDGELDGNDEVQMKKHLDDCPECRRSLEDMRRILDGADDDPGEQSGIDRPEARLDQRLPE